MTLSLQQIKLHEVHMVLNDPFTTSLGTVQKKKFYIVEMIDSKGRSGFGESVAFSEPWYTEETFHSTFHIMLNVLIPILRANALKHPKDLTKLFQPVKRNHMAKAALEGAVWDLYAKQKNISLANALGGERKTIDVGVSLGIETNTKDLLQKIEYYASKGYKRIKIKINRDNDVELLKEIRAHFPDVPLMADANSAYTLKDLSHLQRFDEFNLLMIEQPLGADDLLDHVQLQQALKTPICLDESIHSFEDARMAIELGSCQVINIKPGRVGGLTAAKSIHDLCLENGIGVWCGGMLEAGVGRAHNIALATLSQFNFPGDISASSRYWQKDIISPEVTVENGVIQISEKPGIGFEIDREQLTSFTKKVTTVDF